MYPRAPSSYATQADKWKRQEASWRSASAASGQSNAVSELVLVSELCSAAGQSSFPPKEVLNTFVRVLPSLDRTYVCELLEQKLGDSLWQVAARALLVLDTAFGSNCADDFLIHFFDKREMLMALTTHAKQTVKSRAEKVLTTLKNFEPPTPKAPYQAPSPVRSHYGYQEDLRSPSVQQPHVFFADSPSLLSPPRASYTAPTVSTSSPAPLHRHNTQPPSAFSFLSSPEPAVATPSPAPLHRHNTQPARQAPLGGSAFNFLNAPPPAPAPTPVPAQSGFSFLTSPPTGPVASPAAAPAASAPTAMASAFSFLSNPAPSVAQHDGSGFNFMTLNTPPQAPTPTPAFDVFSQPPTLAIAAPVKQPTPADHIHDAFEGLGSEPDEAMAPEEDLLAGFRPAAPAEAPVNFAALKQAGAAREVVLEIDIPAGPMGVILDKAIPTMGVIERFVPLPTGEKGYIELHPAITPGCALVSVNFTNVEHASLDELGPILAAASGYNRVLKFKKFIVGGRVMHPVLLNVPYMPPSAVDEAQVAADDESEDSQPRDSTTSLGFATPPQRAAIPPSQPAGFNFLLSPPPPATPPQAPSAFSFVGAAPSSPPTTFEFMTQPHYGHGLGAATSTLFPSASTSPSTALVVSPRNRPSPPVSAFSFMTTSASPPAKPLKTQFDGMTADFGSLEIRGSQMSAPPQAAPSAFGFLQAPPQRPAGHFGSPMRAGSQPSLMHTPPQRPPPANSMSAFDFLHNSPQRGRRNSDDSDGAGRDAYAPPPTSQPSAFSFIS
ncbi:hypothetical protein ACHHYP_03783 [Achlya hypogyna]|uniref:Uncharacterized protein n=1 Tax=Achlya hypogyna TaxID=1202772 RepID=A0A1V9Z2X9_ACHHY|nr:hypothetical protein ACHHYP_03783 [Achlya hypogyna]